MRKPEPAADLRVELLSRHRDQTPMLAKTVNQPTRMPGARLPDERVRDIEFAKRLRQLMEERQFTQSDLAAKIWDRYRNSEGKNVARGRDRISVWVNGKNIPDAKNMEKLAKVLRVKVSELAPQSALKSAHQSAVDWSFTRPAGADRGQVFVQIAQYVTAEIAHEIQGLLLRNERELRGAKA
jgi:transcriptional regulator with XRE-family HTH domain